jgi:hypothetical protein
MSANSVTNDPLYGVMVEDCFTLGWEFEGPSFRIEILFSLWPGNVHYSDPRPGEWTCYRGGSLLFKRIDDPQQIVLMNDLTPTENIDGTRDYGTLDSAVIKDGKITVAGPFGEASSKVEDFTYEIDEGT